jgi:hypothetical protein
VVYCFANGKLGLDAPITVSITAILSRDPRPVVDGYTNLPNGTQLMVALFPPREPDAEDRLRRGLSACRFGCMSSQSDARVQNGRFTAGPFSIADHELYPGTYRLWVTVLDVSLQDANVRQILGRLGKNMRGPCAQVKDPAMGPLVNCESEVVVR